MTNFEKPSKIKAVISNLKANRKKHGVTNQAEYNKFRARRRKASSEIFNLKIRNAGEDSGCDV